MSLVHFIRDEKIIDNVIENFNSISNENLFLLFDKKNRDEFRYIKYNGSNLIIFDKTIEINNFLRKENATGLLLHSMYSEFAKELLKIKIDIQIGWIVWGYDMYGLPKVRHKLFGNRTNRFLLFSKKSLFIERFIKNNDSIRKIYFEKIIKKEDYFAIILRAIKRCNFFVTYIEEDFKIFSKYYKTKLQFVYSTFTTIGQSLADNESLHIAPSALNIILGNSCTPENNHIEALHKLGTFKSMLNRDNIKVITPLSYGNNNSYKKKIIKVGKKQLNSSFLPLEDFMERSNYLTILQTCSTGIFYHYRQQAMGNIIALLYMGVRIYLSSKSPVYSYLKRSGIIVFDFDTDFIKYKNKPLDPKTVLKNRAILYNLTNKEKVLFDLRNLSEMFKG
jgi:hypothetical protein